MKNNTLKALGIMVAGTVLAASAGIGCGSKETTDVQPTEVVEAVVETEELEIETEETEAPTEAVVPETETETEEAAFTVTDMSATKYAKSSVNVRKGPASEYEKLGGLSAGQKVTVTGQADTGWYRIDYNGKEGYVSDKYLTDQKVTANASASGNNTGAGSTNTSGNNGNAGTVNNAAAGSTNTSGNSAASGNSNTSGNNGGSESAGNTGNTGSTGNAENSGNTGSTGTPSADAGNTDTSGNNGGSENAGNAGNTDTGNTGDTSGTTGSTGGSENWWEQPEYSDIPVYDPSENVPGDNWVEMGGGITTGGGDSF